MKQDYEKPMIEGILFDEEDTVVNLAGSLEIKPPDHGFEIDY